MNKHFLLAFILIFLVGCQAEYEDVSSSSEYSEIIGKVYEVITPLRVHAVTLDKNYSEAINVYSVTRPPGFGGPEVVQSFSLKSNSIIQIKSVIRCINCFPIYDKFVVSLLSENFDVKAPIHLNDLSIVDDGVKVLDPKFFREKKPIAIK